MIIFIGTSINAVRQICSLFTVDNGARDFSHTRVCADNLKVVDPSGVSAHLNGLKLYQDDGTIEGSNHLREINLDRREEKAEKIRYTIISRRQAIQLFLNDVITLDFGKIMDEKTAMWTGSRSNPILQLQDGYLVFDRAPYIFKSLSIQDYNRRSSRGHGRISNFPLILNFLLFYR